MVKHYLLPRPALPRRHDYYQYNKPGVKVIGPLQFKVESGTYLCEGSGLFHCLGDGSFENGYAFDPDFHKQLPLLEPLRTETGKVRVLQPKIQGNVEILAYWKAQCVFRNLPWTGTVEDLQQWLRSSGELGMHDDVAKLGEKLNEEFWRKNAVAQKQKWDRLETQEKKFCGNAGWFLKPIFSNPGNIQLTMKVPEMHYEKDKVQSAAMALNLCHESANANPEKESGRMRWVVFGRNQSSVTKEIQRLHSETTRIRQISLEAQAERTRILHETVVSEVTADDAFWDVGGLWAINCPSIESKWGVTLGGECSLDIRFAQSRRWGFQMWATFNFIGMEGVFRFVKPRPDSNSDQYSSDEEYCADDFYLDVVDLPSPKCSKFEYDWHGHQNNSEGFFQGKGKLCSLTFDGVGGTELKGWFKSDMTGNCQFTGLTIGQSPRSPSAEWEIIDYKWNEQVNAI